MRVSYLLSAASIDIVLHEWTNDKTFSFELGEVVRDSTDNARKMNFYRIESCLLKILE